MKFGALWAHCLPLALADFGAPSAQKRERKSEMIFWSGKQRAISPTSGRPNFTKLEHKTWIYVAWWILAENIYENFPVRGLFRKRQLLRENLHATSDFRPRFLRNDNKSGKVMTGWHAYGMLAFHLYRWNQLKVILLACRARIRSVLSNWRSRLIYILKNLTAEL